MSICTSCRGRSTSSKIIDSKLEIVYIPEKYHCVPPNIGSFIFYKAVLPCSYYRKKCIYTFNYQSRDTDGVFICIVSKYFTMKSIKSFKPFRHHL